MKSKALGIVSRIIISLAALGLIVYALRNKLNESLHILFTEVQWHSFWLALACYAAALAILAYRLQLIFKVEAIRLKYREIFYLNWVCLFFNFFFPSAVGGDVMKMYYAYKHSKKKIASTTSVILDRFFGLVTMLMMGIAAFSIYGSRLDIPRAHDLLLFFMLAFLFSVCLFSSRKLAHLFGAFGFLLPANIKQVLSEIYHMIHSYKSRRLRVLACIVFSFLAQSFIILTHYFITESLNVHLPLGIFFILVPIIGIVSMAPSLGGLGVREAGMIYIFSRFMTAERALALSLLLDLIVYGFGLAGGLLYAFGGGIKEPDFDTMQGYHVAQ